MQWMSFFRNPFDKSDDKFLSSELGTIANPNCKIGRFLCVATLFRKKAEELATTLEDLTGKEQDLFEMPVLYNISYKEWLVIFKNNYQFLLERDSQ